MQTNLSDLLGIIFFSIKYQLESGAIRLFTNASVLGDPR